MSKSKSKPKPKSNPKSEPKPPAVKRYAVIDIGSVAARLQIGTLADNELLTEVFTRIPLGLGGKTYGNKQRRISAAAIRRLADTLSGMRQLISAMKPCGYSAVATAAIRDAVNREQVVAAVRQHCGVRVRVLSGREEAVIIGRHVAAHFPAAPSVLNIDIGGGSSDCALINNGQLAAAATFSLGTMRDGGGSGAEKARCDEWLREHTPPAAVVSSSGGSALQLQRCCGKLALPQLAKWQKQISGLSVAQIAARYEMPPDRAAHSIDALTLYRLVFRATACEEIHPVQSGLSAALIWSKLAG